MKIAVVGCGYVGLVTGACFADMGHLVHCVERNEDKLAQLQKGQTPLYEPGLDALLRRNRDEGRLHFHRDLPRVLNDVDIVFLAVGTPPGRDGHADLEQIVAVATSIGQHLARPVVIASKSTVPVGTGDHLQSLVDSALAQRHLRLSAPVVSNPEFLKEGCAIDDFMKPDRIIIGSNDDGATRLMQELYAPFNRSRERVLLMRRRDAEMVKYAANGMLATKISFINEIADLCDRLGVDVEKVRLGIGADERIGYHFLYPGLGYGGSCLPKDISALRHLAEDAGIDACLLAAVQQRNELQKGVLLEKVRAFFGDSLQGRHFAVWGLSFKPNTDDLREAPSLAVLENLLRAGATASAYDPAALKRAAAELPPEWLSSGALRLARNQYDALEGADALLLLTEWRCFREPDFDFLAHQLKSRVIFDGRNVLRPEVVLRHGLQWYGIGRSMEAAQMPMPSAEPLAALAAGLAGPRVALRK